MTTRRVPTPTRLTSRYYDTPTPFATLLEQLEPDADRSQLDPVTLTVQKFYGTGIQIVLETSDPLLPPTYQAGFIEAHRGATPYLYFIRKWGDIPSHDPLDARHTVVAHQPRGNQTPFYNLATGKAFSMAKILRDERARWEEWARREGRRPA